MTGEVTPLVCVIAILAGVGGLYPFICAAGFDFLPISAHLALFPGSCARYSLKICQNRAHHSEEAEILLAFLHFRSTSLVHSFRPFLCILATFANFLFLPWRNVMSFACAKIKKDIKKNPSRFRKKLVNLSKINNSKWRKRTGILFCASFLRFQVVYVKKVAVFEFSGSDTQPNTIFPHLTARRMLKFKKNTTQKPFYTAKIILTCKIGPLKKGGGGRIGKDFLAPPKRWQWQHGNLKIGPCLEFDGDVEDASARNGN